jgi:hypothetical protein
MDFITPLLNIIGIGGKALENKAKLKQLKAEQEHSIIKAQTDATVDQIMNNTQSDNAIDLITARDKKFTNKDEIITYTFLIPVFIATITPFIQAYQTGDWTNLSQDIQLSYENLNRLPTWYKYVLGAIIIDVLGFRSFARKLIERYIDK